MTDSCRRLSLVLLATSLLVWPAIAAAQTPNGPAELSAAVGKWVNVANEDGRNFRGKLLSASGQALVIGTSRGDQTIPMASVRRVRRESHAILYGGFIGAGVGTALSVRLINGGGDYGPEVWLPPGIGFGVGLAFGAIINQSTKPSRTIYQRPSTTAVAVSPVLAKGRVGVAGVVSW